MKILFLTDHTYLHGGVEKVLSAKANYFADVFGDEVVIMSTEQQNRKPCYHFSDKIRFYDIGINYKREKSYFHPQNLAKVFTHYKRLENKIKEIRPQIIISCNYSYDFYFLPFINRKIPKIKEFHASRFLDYSSVENLGTKVKILRKLSRFVEKKYHQIVVLNDDEKKFYNSEKISIIPNPINIPPEKATLQNTKILAAGRISPVKNFEELISIFSSISPKFPNWELHFYGQDYIGTKDKLKAQINQLGLNEKVKFCDTVENLQNTMLDYSIYAMTSKSECFPMVLLESLSVGLPIVSYNSPTGPKNIVTNDSDGFIVKYEDLDEFSKKLSMLMNDYKLRIKLGDNAKKNVVRFEMPIIMKKWQDLFINLCNV